MSATPWPAGAATSIGSLPGTDPREAAAVVLGELPDFPHLTELPGRGLGADLVGRTAGLLVDLPVEVVPSGYRWTAHPGVDHRRAEDLMRWDLDALEEAAATTKPGLVKVQVVGPWTLTANVELPRGHRVLTDPGALREFTESLGEGLTRHVAEVKRRTGAEVVVQVDEPSITAVLAGALPTPSGLGTVAPVPEPEAREVLERVVDAAKKASGQPVVVHCCAKRPPVALFREAGATGISFDVTLLGGASAAYLDQLGETWDSGAVFFLGVVPSTDPASTPTLRQLGAPALALADRLGFARVRLPELAVPTPTCGLGGASPAWARKALALTRDLGRVFAEDPESW
ncbi:methionine synthase [Actinokineospora bangkokensis]|uniref:Methionine synthase n=1 Tax=Actinokineospora bangkokensis TaxID=1193682 RepID=A0A1Q9LI36_9PSEU|nr:methionine synthase [Actinokineospora bangkokensis]OLR91629.1 methionine synthase [Actinokineospora bangkokensis]